jgi:hypothetical protein
LSNWRVSPPLSVAFALVAWAIAIVAFSGIILSEDVTGRLIFGFVWTLIGAIWWGQFFQAKKRASSNPANQG